MPRYRHIFLEGPSSSPGYTKPPQKIDQTSRIPQQNRESHSTYLRGQLETAWQSADERVAVAHVTRDGSYIDFISEPASDIPVKSLEDVRSGVRLLNVRDIGTAGSEQIQATVYVPHTQRNSFLKKINDYAEKSTATGKPKNEKLINCIADIRQSVLESFWQPNERAIIPGDEAAWVEVWLRCEEDQVPQESGGSGKTEGFKALASQHRIEVAEGELHFPERAVALIKANRDQLEFLITASDEIAEFRLAKEVASFYVNLENRDQLELVRDLLNRTTFDEDSDVCVCILDHGVNNGHLLIKPVLDDSDLHTVMPHWGTHDHNGHGTLMAGTVAYGDLLEVLNSGNSLHVPHCLESAKILPPSPETNPYQLWGYMTSQGVSLAQIQAPDRKRICCMAVTSSDTRDRGRPSSWSAEIDNITSGADGVVQRLFVISAGNVEGNSEWLNYPDANKTNEIHDPGQSWNALTVGAYTEKVTLADPFLKNYVPIANHGELSPHSTTSLTWDKTWPIKPEVVFEGGNIVKGPNDSIFPADDLSLLSTFFDPQVAQFTPFCATSAAAAQAAWMAAQIQSAYPELWPETLRALMVHSAEWTDALKRQFLPANPLKGDYANLLRICGYGVPNLDRALHCARNTLTLIAQSTLQPYWRNLNGNIATKDMHVYNLPWPVDALLGLGATMVKMRITLSYFVEPGPGEIGWNNRYRYPSHLLRFELNGAGEEEQDFVSRVNRQARDEDSYTGTSGPGDKWRLGPNARNVGSIHSDIWEGTAADLAASNLIAIYPAGGWWKERTHLGRVTSQCRYALVVSIQTPTEEVDIYTPVAVQVGIPIPI